MKYFFLLSGRKVLLRVVVTEPAGRVAGENIFGIVSVQGI